MPKVDHRQSTDAVDEIQTRIRLKNTRVSSVRLSVDDPDQEREAVRASQVTITSNRLKSTSRNSAHMNSQLFVKACGIAGIPATKRQASKFSRKKGLAHRFINQARKDLKESA